MTRPRRAPDWRPTLPDAPPKVQRLEPGPWSGTPGRQARVRAAARRTARTRAILKLLDALDRRPPPNLTRRGGVG